MALLEPGDAVVHIDHGIGRFLGVEEIAVDGVPQACLAVEYDAGDKLYVPVESGDMLTRYGGGAAALRLDRLGGAAWGRRRESAAAHAVEAAGEILRQQAERSTQRAKRVRVADEALERFAAGFPYDLTEDQSDAIDDIRTDLAAGRPMDRLLVGDVGFGKTEVALRAAFLVASTGAQVAVVVPTTLLARQHHEEFLERFEPFDIPVAQLSGLLAEREAQAVRDGLADGSVRIVVGTQAVLAEGIRFKNLGLVVIDEEQRFGVQQKERLKDLRATVHVLSMTATPIPRTLQMALAGLRSLSIVATPPAARKPVDTHVVADEDATVVEALRREHARKGRSYYVCPRIEDLAIQAERLARLVPDLRICAAHGQMPAEEMAARFADFEDGRCEVLLSTNIVETGMDVPEANTLIVHHAELFGLAQLYQLRGRVGRARRQAYAYFAYDPEQPLSPAARQRLDALAEADRLGSGFEIATQDLEIRGGGALLGEAQSGHVKDIGLELYQQLLDDALRAIEEGRTPEPALWTPTLALGLPALIPEDYVADPALRLDLYRRIAQAGDAEAIAAVRTDMRRRFGSKMPEETDRLLRLVALKQACRAAGLLRLEVGPKGASLQFRDAAAAERALAALEQAGHEAKPRPDDKLAVPLATEDAGARLEAAERLAAHLIP
ncbi:MAG TPA: helicase-related protein [Alphaproteobacteria bacterium]|nr:helicase-related protein [Alphaproteobacteria bacterium]